MSKAWWKVRLWLVPTRNWGGTQVATRGKVVQGRRQPTSPFFLYCLSMALARARGACSTYERPSPSVYWHSLLRQPIFSLFDINGVSILHAQSNWDLVDKHRRQRLQLLFTHYCPDFATFQERYSIKYFFNSQSLLYFCWLPAVVFWYCCNIWRFPLLSLSLTQNSPCTVCSHLLP